MLTESGLPAGLVLVEIVGVEMTETGVGAFDDWHMIKILCVFFMYVETKVGKLMWMWDSEMRWEDKMEVPTST